MLRMVFVTWLFLAASWPTYQSQMQTRCDGGNQTSDKIGPEEEVHRLKYSYGAFRKTDIQPSEKNAPRVSN